MVKIRYGNYQKQKAYKNAIQAIYSGYGYSEWDSCGLDFYDADEVWQEAEDSLKRLCVEKSA